MKRICLAALLTFGFIQTYSQHITEKSNKNNPFDFATSIDSLKRAYDSLGFNVLREAPLQMESGFEFPIVVELSLGNQYQVVFIGEYSSRLYEVRMYDWSEKEVAYKKNLWGDVDGNIISYTYSCKFSEPHMIKVVQMNKHMKKLKGYFMIFLRKHTSC